MLLSRRKVLLSFQERDIQTRSRCGIPHVSTKRVCPIVPSKSRSQGQVLGDDVHVEFGGTKVRRSRQTVPVARKGNARSIRRLAIEKRHKAESIVVRQQCICSFVANVHRKMSRHASEETTHGFSHRDQPTIGRGTDASVGVTGKLQMTALSESRFGALENATRQGGRVFVPAAASKVAPIARTSEKRVPKAIGTPTAEYTKARITLATTVIDVTVQDAMRIIRPQ
mmetsp:Transcript_43928/g.133807  ORF Transcript_43928/g.133807 Transcript_43928/m.133807 type:complete len:226 (-) Transcript_43928:290-967(-)